MQVSAITSIGAVRLTLSIRYANMSGLMGARHAKLPDTGAT